MRMERNNNIKKKPILQKQDVPSPPSAINQIDSHAFRKFIDRIEVMKEKEFDFLYMISRRKNVPSEIVEACVDSIKHYEKRIREYEEYYLTIKDY